MELKESLEILIALADGVNPTTGEQYPDDSPYQSPQIIRALYTAIHNLNTKPKKDSSDRVGEKWSQEEENELIKRFEEGLPFEEIAHLHQRTRGGIIRRLERIGLIED